MKRLTALFCVLSIILFSCGAPLVRTPLSEPPRTIPDAVRGVWLTYAQWNPTGAETAAQYKTDLNARLARLEPLGLTDLFVQVRPFGDAVYPSKLFPAAACVTGKRGAALPFDFLTALLETAKARGLRVHAWINPYRLSNDPTSLDLLKHDPVVGAWLDEPGQTDVRVTESGIFLNPASLRARQLIVDGVTELLNGYDLNGVHMDDYFYPTTDAAFDGREYDLYRKEGGVMGRAEWRRENVDALLRSLYCAAKARERPVLFTVSPCADVEKNERTLYANVRKWCREDGYCDKIIPQIYFGFRHETLPFKHTLKVWRRLCAGCPDRLWVGLAAYKAGKTDPYAGAAGRDEWVEDDAVLERQVALVERIGCGGIVYFSFVELTG